MRGDKQKISVRYKDTGQVSRISRSNADKLVNRGQGEFVSKSIWRAARAGVKVTPGMTDAQIKEAIRISKEPPPKAEEKNGTEESKGNPHAGRGKNRKTRTR